MKNILSILGCVLSAGLLCAADIVLGTPDFGITLDKETGSWKTLQVKGKTVAANDRKRPPFDLELADRKRFFAGVRFRLKTVEKTAENTFDAVIAAGDITAKIRYQFFPEKKRFLRSFTLTNTGTQTVDIFKFTSAMPGIAFGKESCYYCPGYFPSWGKRYLKNLRPGKAAIHWRDPGVTIVQLDKKNSLLNFYDRTRPYSDISRMEILERTGGIEIIQLCEASGRLLPGKTWQIGDFHTGYLPADADKALRHVHNSMAEIGMKVPADRNEAVKNVTLYSFHPGMANHPLQDWGGFVPSTRQLPRIAALNCNTVWILPVESECPYIPDDFYKMAPGIGTPEEYKKLVDTAHGLGMKVWQDVVPHGGRKTNSRAKAHPEWLLQDEKGNVPRNRSFDYNHPGWQNFLGKVVEDYTRNYTLDGWRIDTSGFSARTNWNRAIPYSRASHAMGQGGLNMMRRLRNDARKVNPQAVTLGECDGSIFGTQADMVYDFPLCRNVLKSLRTMPPEAFAKALAVWLDEQQHAELQDLVRLRYVDSHDEPRAELYYGPAALRAAFALTAWVHGIPMIYKEAEDGHSAVFARILKMRLALNELSYGSADYRSCRTSPGIWACLRSDGRNRSIPVINFNPEKSRIRLAVPAEKLPRTTMVNELWYGRKIPVKREQEMAVMEFELPAYGFTLLRFGDIPAGLDATSPIVPAEKLLPYQIAVQTENMTVYRFMQNEEPLFWRAESACGTVEDRFRTRHPYYPPMLTNMYSNPLGHNTLWSSLQQPFGFTAESARLTLFSSKGSAAFTFTGGKRPAGVFLCDQFGDVQGPHVVVVRHVPDTPLAGEWVDCRISTMKRPAAETSSGDSRLKHIAGGWIFDNGKIRLRIANNGSLTEFRKKKNGKWVTEMENVAVNLKGGFIPSHKTYTSANEMEGLGYMEKAADGTLLLRFTGRPRGGHFYDILKPGTVEYFMAYTLNGSDSFALVSGVRTDIRPAGGKMALSLAGKGFRHDFRIPEKDFGRWHTFSAVFGGKGKDAPKPVQNISSRAISTEMNGLLDPSFEFEYDALFAKAVTSVAVSLPWLLPPETEIVGKNAADGKKCVRLKLHDRHERVLKQTFRPRPMRPGEKWRLSVKIKADKVQKSRCVMRLVIPGKGVQRVSIPGGSYDYREFFIDFSAPENPGSFEVQIGGKAAAGTLFIDAVRIDRH